MSAPKKTLLVLALLVLAITLFALSHGWNASANVFDLYAQDCVGGWENVEYATGAPVTASSSGSFALTENNSAILRDGREGQIACSGFHGAVLAGSVPKKVKVKFSWVANYPSEIVAPILPQTTVVTGTSTPTDATGTIVVTSFDGGSSETSAQLLIATTTESTTTVAGGVTGVENATSSNTAMEVSTTTPTTTSEVVAPKPLGATTTEVAPPALESPSVPPSPAPTTPPADIVPAQPSPDPAPAAPAPAENTPPVSLLQFFGQLAFAEEVSSAMNTSTIASIPAEELSGSTSTMSLSTTTPIETIKSEDAVSSTTTSEEATSTPYGIVEVLYSLKGEEWKSLGYVEKSEFASKEFEIPAESMAGWDDIAHLQIAVRSVPTMDAVRPLIMLDAVWLSVEYDTTLEDPHPNPAAWRGDEFIGEATYPPYAAVLVARPKSTDTITLSSMTDSATTTSSTTPSSLGIASSTAQISPEKVIELWLRDDARSTSTPGWTLIASGDPLTAQTKVFYREGNIFWLARGTLWRFNPLSNAYDSTSLEPSGATPVYFTNESGEKKIVIVNEPDDTVAFEDYISPDATTP